MIINTKRKKDNWRLKRQRRKEKNPVGDTKRNYCQSKTENGIDIEKKKIETTPSKWDE